MKKLSSLLEGWKLLDQKGEMDMEILDIAIDSRKVAPGTLFIAMEGSLVDGHDFIDQAIENGATAILLEKLPDVLKEDTTYVKVENSRKMASFIAAEFFGQPAQKMKVVGITGTNGKTTVATLGYQLTKALGFKAGLLSTAGNWIDEIPHDATHTTPDPVQLQYWLAKMVEEGCEWVWMEVSSHALDQHRADAIDFKGAIFTNLTHDHLDYHGDFKSYLTAKKRLFDDLGKDAVALINRDDKTGNVMVQNCDARIKTYAAKSMADYQVRILDQTFEGLILYVNEREVHAQILGEYNAYNFVAVFGIATELGLNEEEVLVALSGVQGAEGRFDRVLDAKNDRLGIVDYAHTPDALEKVLLAIKKVNKQKGRVITVVGCGGDRDKAKRPVMARIASDLSDKVILTSDNPRSEDPDSIIKDMIKGVEEEQRHKVLEVTNRKQAIKVACTMAEQGDIVLVAGKGHEKYQEIKGKRIVFDDKQELKEALQ